MITEDFQDKQIDKFVLKKVIARGVFSAIYLAEENNFRKSKNSHENKNHHNYNPDDKHYSVCKIIPIKKNIIKHKSSKFNKEIKIHRLMHHPNVVQLIDVQKDSNYYYVFIEYCSNGDLFNYIYNRNKLTDQESSYFLKQILIGLKYIHSLNVAHCDIKPENILLDASFHAKICDFGTSKIFHHNKNGFTRATYGSPSYRSPESLSGHPYDAQKSDIWACGVILFEMATGLCPWSKKSDSNLADQIKNGKYSIPSDVSDMCADLIRKLMNVDYKKRIAINEALNHPFLKNVDINSTKFQHNVALP